MTKILKNMLFAPAFCGLAQLHGTLKVEAWKSYPQSFRLFRFKKVA